MARRSDGVGRLQQRAWAYYGYPGSEQRAVGEVRYVNGWLADQMTRLDWDVLIDGSEAWTVALTENEDGSPGESITASDDLTESSADLLALIDWDDANVRAITTNLFVAGQGDYANLDKGWRVVSAIDPDRKKLLRDVEEQVPFIWPHPADPKKPDAPLFAVLELLDSLDWLTRQARTQSRQRVLINGIVAVADGFQGPNGTDFWEQWNEALSVLMSDPDDLSPIRLKGALELVKEGVNWIMPDFKYDERIDKRAEAAIQRLAYGLPVPPEILLGMQAQSRATAFQVEENAYRAHIEPPALMVAQVAADALELILDGDRTVEVIPNPAQLLARRNSVEDVKWAQSVGLVTDEYTREVLGIPEDAAPDPADQQPAPPPPRPIEKDPANDAAAEGSPIAASVSGVGELSQLLSDIDAALSSELAGVTVMATDRARQRLGAGARRNDMVRANKELKTLTSEQLATRLGVQGLQAAGVSVEDMIAEPVDTACRWWVRRIGEAWSQAATLVPGWKGQGAWVEQSVDVLAGSLGQHIVDTLGTELVSPLAAGDIRAIVDAAAGGQAA